MPLVITIQGADSVAQSADPIRAVVDGVETGYGSIETAVAAVGTMVGELIVGKSTALSSSITIPKTMTLRITGAAVIDYGVHTLTVNGRFPWPAGKCFAGATGRVVFGYDTCGMIFPQWWGAVGDARADGSGTNSTAAFRAAIAASTSSGRADGVSIHPVYAGQGNWLVGNLVFPIAYRMFAAGRHSTNFIAPDGTVGKHFTDGGSASKIILEGFAMYGRNLPGLTHGLELGRNGVEHGTEGYVRDIWIRDYSALGAYGLDVMSNVGIYHNITLQNCSRNRVFGGPSDCGGIVVMQPREVGIDLAYCSVSGLLHIEAPAGNCVPLRLSRNSRIGMLSIAVANGTDIQSFVEIDPACQSWRIDSVNYFFGSDPSAIRVAGNIKSADGTYFGGNASGGSLSGNGNYSS